MEYSVNLVSLVIFRSSKKLWHDVGQTRLCVCMYIYMDTNKHDIIVTEAFRAALFKVKKIAASEEGSEGVCFICRSQ